MANPTLPLLAVAFAGSAATALAVTLLAAPSPGDVTASSTVTADVVSRQRERIEQLDGQVRRLQDQVDALQLDMTLPEPVAVQPLIAGEPQLVARLAELETRLDEELPTAAGVPAGALRDQVAVAVESLRDQEQAERDERRAERDAERLERFAERLGLEPWQTEQLGMLAATAEERRDAMRDNPLLEDDRDARREARDALTAEVRLQAEGFMTVEQLAAFDERGGLGGLRDDDRRGGRGRGGRD